jgi:hypothetical protein
VVAVGVLVVAAGVDEAELAEKLNGEAGKDDVGAQGEEDEGEKGDEAEAKAEDVGAEIDPKGLLLEPRPWLDSASSEGVAGEKANELAGVGDAGGVEGEPSARDMNENEDNALAELVAGLLPVLRPPFRLPAARRLASPSGTGALHMKGVVAVTRMGLSAMCSPFSLMTIT